MLSFVLFDPTLLVFLVIGLVVIVGAAAAHLWNQKRIAAIRIEAEKQGLRFDRCRDRELPKQFLPIPIFSEGRWQWTTLKLIGTHCKETVTVFELCCEIVRSGHKGSSRHLKHYQGVILELPKTFPFLLLRPEHLLDKMGTMVGIDDIDFESHQFSQRYHVSCEAKKFAYDFFHIRMIETFLLQKPHCFAIHQNHLVIYEPGFLQPHHISKHQKTIIHIREQMPAYLFEKSQPESTEKEVWY